jgi:thymidine kinase
MDLDFEFTKRAKLIIIEEAQFYEDLVLFVKWAVETAKKDVVVVGLDGDYERKAFGQVLDCIPLADKVTKLTALCMCSKPAPFTKRKESMSSKVYIGGSEAYVPQCRECYINN